MMCVIPTIGHDPCVPYRGPADMIGAIAAYERLAKAIMSDAPASMRTDRCVGLGGVLAAAVEALAAYQAAWGDGEPT